MSGGPDFTTSAMERLARLTNARVGLGRAGVALPTRDLLRFGLAHAQARDAVNEPLRTDDLAAAIAELGLGTIEVASRAATRAEYLRRPDLGRSLAPEGLDRLAADRGAYDLAIVVADGLSATAVHRHAAPFLRALLPHLAERALRLAPVVIALQARVALGDAVAEALGARMVLTVIGERPGLSSPDSLGAYLTFGPHHGLTDADRNCVSNIRPGGLTFDVAGFTVGWLVGEALRRSLTGVALKDDSAAALAAGGARPLIGGG
jgi:ethanolamine ammonia-lyase small subunit